MKTWNYRVHSIEWDLDNGECCGPDDECSNCKPVLQEEYTGTVECEWVYCEARKECTLCTGDTVRRLAIDDVSDVSGWLITSCEVEITEHEPA